MTDAARQHLQTVTNARAEAQTLGMEAGTLNQHVTDAAAKVTEALNTLAEKVGVIAAQADTTKTAVESACIAADEHTAKTQETGHETLNLVLAAQNNCNDASLATDSVTDFLGNLGAVVEHAKNEAINMVMGVLAQVTEFADGATNVDQHLGEAETHIRQTLGN